MPFISKVQVGEANYLKIFLSEATLDEPYAGYAPNDLSFEPF